MDDTRHATRGFRAKVARTSFTCPQCKQHVVAGKHRVAQDYQEGGMWVHFRCLIYRYKSQAAG